MTNIVLSYIRFIPRFFANVKYRSINQVIIPLKIFIPLPYFIELFLQEFLIKFLIISF